MIHNFTNSTKLFRFIVDEQHYIAREIGLAHWQIAKIARRINVNEKHLESRIRGDVQGSSPTLVNAFAKDLGAELKLIVVYGISTTEYEFNNEGCQTAYEYMNNIREILLQSGRKEYTLRQLAKNMHVSVTQLRQTMLFRNNFVSLDRLVQLGTALGISVRLEVTHDFQHCAE